MQCDLFNKQKCIAENAQKEKSKQTWGYSGRVLNPDLNLNEYKSLRTTTSQLDNEDIFKDTLCCKSIGLYRKKVFEPESSL